MNAILHLLLFILILFIYIHVSEQYKTSNDMEIYEMDYIDCKQLQTTCSIKQPILFDFQSIYPEFFDVVEYERLSEYNPYEMKVRDNEDYYQEGATIDYTILPLSATMVLINSDTNKRYFSEDNHSFVDDAGLMRTFNKCSSYLAPDITVQTTYDVMIGAKGAITPLRYHTHYRHFMCVMSGKIRIKMTPWKSSKHLLPVKDYDSYEFRSPIHVWKPQREYFHNMDKVKFLEFDVSSGSMIYVPPYWWYSIQYSEEPDNLITGITYDTITSCLSNVPDTCMYFLQQSNIKHRVSKSISPISSLPIHEGESAEVVSEVDNTNTDDSSKKMI